MKNKELLLEAIDNYSEYTLKQKELLTILVKLAIEDIVVITPIEIGKQMNVTKGTVYFHLKALEKDGVISAIADRMNKFRLNIPRLNYILQNHENKKTAFGGK